MEEKNIKFSVTDYSSHTYSRDDVKKELYVREDSAFLAASIYRFLLSLSSTTRHFIYRNVVRNMISYSLGLDEDEAIRQLCLSLTRNIVYGYDEDKIDRIFKCFAANKVDSQKSLFVEAFRTNNGDLLKVLISAVPEEKEIYKVYAAFDPIDKSWEDDEKFNDLVKRIEGKLNVIRNNGLNTETWADAAWSFTPFGYLTVFENWLNNNEASNPYEYYFFNLYIKGKVLDFVIDTMFKSDVSAIGYRIFRSIEATCRDNETFCEYIQERYEYYRIIHPEIPDRKFICSKTKNQEGRKSALAPINKGKFRKDLRYMDQDELLRLYDKLSLQFIKCDPNEFLELFSGDGNTTNTISWLGSVSQLGAFLKVYKVRQSEMDMPRIKQLASEIFIIRRTGKNPSSNSLGQKIDEGATKTFDRMFDEIG